MCNECVDEVWIIVVVKNEMLVVFDEQVLVYRLVCVVWESQEKVKEILVVGKKYMCGLFEDKMCEMQQILLGKKVLYCLGVMIEIEDKFYWVFEGVDKVKQIFGLLEKCWWMWVLFFDQVFFDIFVWCMEIESEFFKIFVQGWGSFMVECLVEVEDIVGDIVISLLDNWSF